MHIVECLAVYVFAAGEQVPAELRDQLSSAALAIWTTTPWTMPANAAVAVNEKLHYSLVEAQASFDSYFRCDVIRHALSNS